MIHFHLLPALLANFVLGLADNQQSFLDSYPLSSNVHQGVLEHHPASDAQGSNCPYAVGALSFSMQYYI